MWFLYIWVSALMYVLYIWVNTSMYFYFFLVNAFMWFLYIWVNTFMYFYLFFGQGFLIQTINASEVYLHISTATYIHVFSLKLGFEVGFSVLET
jgi:hypothetical protein